ncbi:MAG: M14-type cytosolic carboxypeptidase [Opitutaceae bacterium]|nr:M14-type cytosolic carboxypeptidase [Opitutaceae bacterium]
MRRLAPLILLTVFLRAGIGAAAPATPPVLFNTAWEGASVGLVEVLGETEFRVRPRGQQDARGRNRQTTWWAVRMDQLEGRAVTVRVTGFDGEYNDRPVISWAGAWYRPVMSRDGERWTHVENAAWDAERKEVRFTLPAGAATLWLAHIPPYPVGRAHALVDEAGRSPHARVEEIGRSVLGRPLQLVRVTDGGVPDAGKRVIWMQARQHAWEADTSRILEGALRFALSGDPVAARLRAGNVLWFLPMINPDSVARGEVRFNANGFDPNRHWDEADPRDERWRVRAPEIWHVKRAMLERHARQPIDLALNLHNTETGEYLETMADDDAVLARMTRFHELALTRSTFDPSRPKLAVTPAGGGGPRNTTNAIWVEARVPMMLLETRIGPGRKLARDPTEEDRLELGRTLVALLAEAAR